MMATKSAGSTKNIRVAPGSEYAMTNGSDWRGTHDMQGAPSGGGDMATHHQNAAIATGIGTMTPIGRVTVGPEAAARQRSGP